MTKGETCYRVRLDGTILGSNTASPTRTTLPATIFDQIHPNDLPQLKEIFNMFAFRPEELYDAVYRKILPSGRTQWIDAKLYASIQVGSSTADEVFVVEKDIGDDLMRVKLLTEERERLKDLVENQQDVLYALDLDGNFVTVAYSAFGLWGYVPDELVGKNCWGMLRERERAEVTTLINRYIAQRDSLGPFVVERLCKNNSYCREEIRLNLKIDPQTNLVIGLNGVSRKMERNIPSSPPPELPVPLEEKAPQPFVNNPPTYSHQPTTTDHLAQTPRPFALPHPAPQQYAYAPTQPHPYPYAPYPAQFPPTYYPPQTHQPQQLQQLQQHHFPAPFPHPYYHPQHYAPPASQAMPYPSHIPVGHSPDEINALNTLSTLSSAASSPNASPSDHQKSPALVQKSRGSTPDLSQEDQSDHESGSEEDQGSSPSEHHGKRKKRHGEEDDDYTPKAKKSKTIPSTPTSTTTSTTTRKSSLEGSSSNGGVPTSPTSRAEDSAKPKRVEKESPYKIPCQGENCHVEKSLEWRKGADGRKTLCNACGLRYQRALKSGRAQPSSNV